MKIDQLEGNSQDRITVQSGIGRWKKETTILAEFPLGRAHYGNAGKPSSVLPEGIDKLDMTKVGMKNSEITIEGQAVNGRVNVKLVSGQGSEKISRFRQVNVYAANVDAWLQTDGKKPVREPSKRDEDSIGHFSHANKVESTIWQQLKKKSKQLRTKKPTKVISLL